MKIFIALLRGINVGGRNKLPMKELAALMESLGAKDVRTYIQSGNVVFRAAGNAGPRLAPQIRDAIRKRHGFEPEVTLLGNDAIESAISENPFPEADSAPTTVHLMFLAARPEDPDLASLERIRTPTERFALKDKVFFLHAPDGIGRSKLAARIERAMGVSGTARNWRTVRKLQDMARALCE